MKIRKKINMVSPVVSIPNMIVGQQTLKEKIEQRRKQNESSNENLDKISKMIDEHPELEEIVKLMQQNGIY